MDKPTVPNADVVSNKTVRKSAFSVIQRIIVAPRTRKTAAKVIVSALCTLLSSTRCLKNTTSRRPRIIAQTAPRSVTKVVVLIPPPVEPGEAQ